MMYSTIAFPWQHILKKMFYYCSSCYIFDSQVSGPIEPGAVISQTYIFISERQLYLHCSILWKIFTFMLKYQAYRPCGIHLSKMS